jgi:hypothetical protein
MSAVPVSVVEGALKSFFIPEAQASTCTYYTEPYEVSSSSWSGQETHGATGKNYEVTSTGSLELYGLGMAVPTAKELRESVALINKHRYAWPVVNLGVAIPREFKSRWYSIEFGCRGLDSGNSTTENVKLQAELLVSTMKTFLHANSRRKALDYMYEVLEDAYSESDLGLVNEMLFCASKILIGDSLAVSFLRATSRVKNRSIYWAFYCSRVKQSLEGNPDADRILRGLA